MAKHAKLGPSSGKRWLHCAGSPTACADIPNRESDASDQGTAGHLIFSRWVEDSIPPAEWLSQAIALDNGNAVEATQELVDWVAEATHWVKNYLVAHPHATVFSELRVNIDPAFALPTAHDPELMVLWGTADLVIVTADELVVFDLKLGFHDVDVEGNEQLLLYATGIEHDWSAFSFEQIRLVIFQPRSGGAKEHVISVDELRAWRDAHRPAVLAALDPASPRTASEKACQWCPAAPTCPELHRQELAIAQHEFAVADQMTVEQIAQVLSRAKMVAGLIKAVKRHAIQMLRLGQEVPGFKLVEGKRNRMWTDELEARRLLETEFDVDEIAPRKLISPAQAEKLLGKKEAKERLAGLIGKPEGEPTIAPLSDRRKALEPDFQALPDEDEEEAELDEIA